MATRQYGMAKEDKMLVVAIHIGTTHSCYAFSFKNDYRNDPIRIKTNNLWASGYMGLLSGKTATCVLFDEKQEFHSFGYEAENYYTELQLDEEHHNWHFFKSFKMQLPIMKMHRDVELEDDQGRRMPAMRVFAESIRYMQLHCLDLIIRKHGVDIDNRDIHWVLTVPALWPNSAGQFMREAAIMAGIGDEQLSTALEPEAASLYCQCLPDDQIHGSQQKCEISRCGSKFMVVDLGGCTADITVHERQPDGSLRMLQNPCRGPWGGDRVDQDFFEFISRIVGAQVFKKFKEENMADFLDLQREFETKKRVINPTTEGKVTIKVPMSILNIYEEEREENIKVGIEKSPYKGQVVSVSDKLRMNADLFKGFFKDCGISIVEKIKEILSCPEVKGTNTFLVVGGSSESSIIQDAIMKALPTGNFFIPEGPGLAALRGAVIFGHQPQPVVEISRVA